MVIVLALSVAAAGCGSETKVTRVDTNVATDFSGRWNDTDSRLVAETMVKESLASPWLEARSGGGRMAAGCPNPPFPFKAVPFSAIFRG
jgi:hypothetical protein